MILRQVISAGLYEAWAAIIAFAVAYWGIYWPARWAVRKWRA